MSLSAVIIPLSVGMFICLSVYLCDERHSVCILFSYARLFICRKELEGSLILKSRSTRYHELICCCSEDAKCPDYVFAILIAYTPDYSLIRL